jgi:hypothetical protein
MCTNSCICAPGCTSTHICIIPHIIPGCTNKHAFVLPWVCSSSSLKRTSMQSETYFIQCPYIASIVIVLPLHSEHSKHTRALTLENEHAMNTRGRNRQNPGARAGVPACEPGATRGLGAGCWGRGAGCWRCGHYPTAPTTPLVPQHQLCHREWRRGKGGGTGPPAPGRVGATIHGQ